MKSSEKTTLDQLQRNEKAVIVSLNEAHIPLKLFELGCFVGNSVQLLERAPFGDPLYVCVNDSYITLRKETARWIEVQKQDKS